MLLLLASNGCALELSETTSEATAPTIVSLTFDDTLADQFQVGAMLASRGLHATFFVNSSRFGGDIYMTSAQVQQLLAAGNELGGHTLRHPHLPTLDRDDARREICNDRSALIAAGVRATTFAYPFGDANRAIESIAQACGYVSARDVAGLVSGSGCNGCPFANTIPPDDTFNVRTPDSIKTTTTLAQLETYVTQAEQHGGGWVPLVFHHVCNGCNVDSVSPATLTAFLDWLAPRASLGTTVQTYGQVMGGSFQGAVAAPVPAAVINASLDIDDNNDDIPDCWMRGGSGTNTATFTSTSNSFDGDNAQRIDITSYTSGARRLVTMQDTGVCAPRAFPGRTYQLTGHYIATVQPVFTVYYRNTAGTWVFFAQSPRFPVSSTYATATYTTQPLPADATAISFGLSITAVGSLTMDALSLSDPGDAAPTVTLTAPAAGASVRNTIQLAASASDATGVDHVEFRAADRLIGWSDSAPYQLAWDTREAAGPITLAARAFDRAGNAATSTIDITVDNVAPTAAVSSPADNANVTGTTPIVAAVSDNIGITRVRFYLDNVQLGTRTITPYRWNWNTTTTTLGRHTLAVQAEDAAGNATRSASITVVVQ